MVRVGRFLLTLLVTVTMLAPAALAGPAKRAFVTSTAYPADLGGLAGADAKCQARADAAGLGGTWHAWLSTYTVNAKSRVDDAAYARLDGVVVAASLADLTDGALAQGLFKNELGATWLYQTWTGTAPDGTAVAQTCSDWTSTTGASQVGYSEANDSKWTANNTWVCDGSLALYCFEVSVAPPPVPTLGEWGVIASLLLLAGLAFRRLRRAPQPA